MIMCIYNIADNFSAWNLDIRIHMYINLLYVAAIITHTFFTCIQHFITYVAIYTSQHHNTDLV